MEKTPLLEQILSSCQNVVVGENAIVGAGSMVTKDALENTMAA
jgi:serine acetyltransferase